MPRYLVERIFVDGPQIPADAQGAEACLNVVDVNGTQGFTWIHSYVTDEVARPSASTTAPIPGRSGPPLSARPAGRPDLRGTGPRPLLPPLTQEGDNATHHHRRADPGAADHHQTEDVIMRCRDRSRTVSDHGG
jgi:hypothetical protein